MLTSRPYAHDSDAVLMAELASRSSSPAPRYSYWHPGDVWWALFHDEWRDPTRLARIFEDGGEAIGFAIMYDDGQLSWAVVPEYPEPSRLGEAALQWGESHVRTLPPGRLGPVHLTVEALAGDTGREEMLRARGFRRGDDPTLHFVYALDREIPAVGLPAGFGVGHVGGEEEWEERVNAHRDVWNPSKVTLKAYRRQRTLPGYRPDLDLVVRAPYGEIASYCIVWWDERNRTGEFEPVGTRARYRGMGLGRALMMEGLRRLQTLGGRFAVVYTTRSNHPADMFYEACGFEIAGEAYFWRPG
jgi:ribosomal protein S18 acetylase RimI-like enzyme